jgi:hypothetical protein
VFFYIEKDLEKRKEILSVYKLKFGEYDERASSFYGGKGGQSYEGGEENTLLQKIQLYKVFLVS